MSKIKKDYAYKKVPRKKLGLGIVLGTSDGDTFEIETNPPSNMGRSTHPETIIFLEKLDLTISRAKPGYAFILPAKRKSVARKHLTKGYPKEVFYIAKVKDNPYVCRVYWVKNKTK